MDIRITKSALDNIAKEMFWTAIRTAKSSIIYETFDFAPALTDKNGNLISIGTGISVFLGIMPLIAKSVLEDVEKYDLGLDPGDIFIINDPYRISTHLNDVALAMPIFYKNKFIGMATIRGHVNDVGGMNPGSWGPNATEIYQEGLIIPTSHFYRKGKLNKEIANMILSNSRIPDFVYGDLEGFAASLRYAYKRINELCDKYGVSVVLQAMEDRLEDGRIMARNRLKNLPKGTFFAEDRLMKLEGMDDDFIFKAKVTISDKKFTVDLSGNPPQVKAPINTTYPGTWTGVATAFVAATDPHVPLNQGYLEYIEAIAPEGTIFNALPPAPVSTYWETMFYVVDLIWKALAPSIPERFTAGHFLSVVAEIIGMKDPRDNRFKILVEPNPGGWGAGKDKDGESCLVAAADGETYCNSAELLEREFPIRVECMKLNTEDGVGHGEHRGGFGLRKEYFIMSEEATFTTSLSRCKYPPWGVDGGMNGTTNYMAIIRNGKEIWRGSRIVNMPLKKGDIVRIVSGSGGGWGHPLKRDPEKVLEDVKNRFITIEVAKNIYGVVIDPQNLEINWNETMLIRKNLFGGERN